MKLFLGVATGLFALMLGACGKNEQTVVSLDPVAIHAGDECHLCGMIINEWPGPKGEAINNRSGEVLKFCSTTDMFSWWLQPENKTMQATIYVHDMALSHWDKPDDEHLIDARSAWFVVGSHKLGMGPTLASFGTQTAAQAFAEKEGGRVLSFDEITPAVLHEVAMQGHDHIEQINEQIQHQQHGETPVAAPHEHHGH